MSVDLKGIMLNKRSQTQKATYCMIPFTRYSGKGKTTRLENKQIRALLELRVGGRANDQEAAQGNLEG